MAAQTTAPWREELLRRGATRREVIREQKMSSPQNELVDLRRRRRQQQLPVHQLVPLVQECAATARNARSP